LAVRHPAGRRIVARYLVYEQGPVPQLGGLAYPDLDVIGGCTAPEYRVTISLIIFRTRVRRRHLTIVNDAAYQEGYEKQHTQRDYRATAYKVVCACHSNYRLS
jgi:hypothetical protein